MRRSKLHGTFRIVSIVWETVEATERLLNVSHRGRPSCWVSTFALLHLTDLMTALAALHHTIFCSSLICVLLNCTDEGLVHFGSAAPRCLGHDSLDPRILSLGRFFRVSNLKALALSKHFDRSRRSSRAGSADSGTRSVV